MIQRPSATVPAALLCFLCGILSAQESPTAAPDAQNGAAAVEAVGGGPPKIMFSNAEAVKLVGWTFWENHANLILGRVDAVKPAEKNSTHADFEYEITVVADARGILKPGGSMTVGCSFLGGDPGIVPPLYEKGAVVLLCTAPTPGSAPSYEEYMPMRCPFGWYCPRLVPEADTKAIQGALAMLRSAIPEHPDDPLDRAKALELFSSKNYEAWALGASMLGVIKTDQAANANLLMGVINDPHTDMTRALWAFGALENMTFENGENTNDDLHKTAFGGELRDDAVPNALAMHLVTDSPQLCEYPPTALPTTQAQPDNAASARANAATMKAWAAEASAQIQGIKSEEQAATLLMGADFWKHHGNLILAKVTAVQKKSKGDGDVVYTMEVLAEARGSYKAGTVVKVVGNLMATDADRIPPFDKDMVVLLGVKPGDGRDTLAYAANVCSPVGWRSGRPIPADHVKAVQIALSILQAALPQHAGDPLDHAKAAELFRSKEYETWAIGAAILAAEGTQKDFDLLDDAISIGSYEGMPLPQAMWIVYEKARSPYQAASNSANTWNDLVNAIAYQIAQLGNGFINSPRYHYGDEAPDEAKATFFTQTATTQH